MLSISNGHAAPRGNALRLPSAAKLLQIGSGQIASVFSEGENGSARREAAKSKGNLG
jgi:hypothetical protein